MAQRADHCGPAALAMVLAWSGKAVPVGRLAEQSFTPGREGTLRSGLVAAARRQGRLVVPVADLGALVREVAAGHPVVVLQNRGLAWLPRWHYALVIGYDRPQGQVILHSGRERRRPVNLGVFQRTWQRADRWAVVVLPPGELPAAAGELAVVRGLAALEQAGQPAAAEAGYAAALKRWPQSLAAAMGLGNTRLAQGRAEEAVEAFRTAVDRHPEKPQPWNNLAVALHRLGKRQAALTAARRALELAGGESATYSDTLNKIRARPRADPGE